MRYDPACAVRPRTWAGPTAGLASAVSRTTRAHVSTTHHVFCGRRTAPSLGPVRTHPPVRASSAHLPHPCIIYLSIQHSPFAPARVHAHTSSISCPRSRPPGPAAARVRGVAARGPTGTHRRSTQEGQVRGIRETGSGARYGHHGKSALRCCCCCCYCCSCRSGSGGGGEGRRVPTFGRSAGRRAVACNCSCGGGRGRGRGGGRVQLAGAILICREGGMEQGRRGRGRGTIPREARVEAASTEGPAPTADASTSARLRLGLLGATAPAISLHALPTWQGAPVGQR
jgi:hypothetical protein